MYHVDYILCAVFVVSTFAGDMGGRSKVEPVLCESMLCTLSPHDVKNIPTVIEQSQS